MNEETIIEKRPAVNSVNEIKGEKKSKGAWKHVTLGGVSGILMGAGLLYGGQVAAKELDKPEDATEQAAEEAQAAEGGLHVATTHDEMSFGEAFAAARAEVGPGGVFHWHGGVYNTYTADEWNSMTPDQKHEFAQQVQPEVDANHVSTPTDAHPDVAVHNAADTSHQSADTSHQTTDTEDVMVVSEEAAQSYQALENEDVHIVGYTNVDDHLAVGYDLNGDGQTDVAIIDLGQEGLSPDDIVVNSRGAAATVGDIMNSTPEPTNDPNLTASMENPDVAPDMPDYVNDGLVDA